MDRQLEENKPFTKWEKVFRVILLAAVLALTILLRVYREQIQHLEAYGYPGIFLLSIMPNATELLT